MEENGKPDLTSAAGKKSFPEHYGSPLFGHTIREVIYMSKDSQPDNKTARKKKSKNQTPITRENQNQNKNAKKQSIENNDV